MPGAHCLRGKRVQGLRAQFSQTSFAMDPEKCMQEVKIRGTIKGNGDTVCHMDIFATEHEHCLQEVRVQGKVEQRHELTHTTEEPEECKQQVCIQEKQGR
eukprot:scaffold232886_cov21-Tisochrysis_lutea.AAC.1